MKNILSILFLLVVSQFAFASTFTFTAEVATIEKDYIVIAESKEKFMLVNKHSPAYTRMGSSFKTKYYIDGRSRPTSFDTLAGVGYITKAQITIEDNLVKEIIVLDMHM